MTIDHALPRIVTIGETMLMLSPPEVGRINYANSLDIRIGGSESNTAIGLARLGFPVTWVSRVSDDSIGDRIVQIIAGEGVTPTVTTDPGATSGLMIKERTPGGSTKVWYYRKGSAASRLNIDDIRDSDILGAGLLHLTGITFALSDSAREAGKKAISIAKSAGIPISFDVNYRAQLLSASEASDLYRPLLADCDILFAGEREAELLLTGNDDAVIAPIDMARRLVELGPRQVVIKRGARGVVAVIDGEPYRASPYPVKVVDTVGAGDGFSAGYLAEYLAGATPQARLDLGTRTGAMACTVSDDWQGLPTRRDLESALPTDAVVR